MLLLLQQVNIANKWDSANCLAVLCVWDRDAFKVGEVWSIIFTFAAFDGARDLGDDISWPFISVKRSVLIRLTPAKGRAVLVSLE